MRSTLAKIAVIISLSACDGSNESGGGSDGDIPVEYIVGGAIVVGGYYTLKEFLNRRSEAADQSMINSDPIAARRAFSGPKEYDPSEFEVYGMVAFPAAPTSADYSRFVMICEAYMQGISPVSDGAPISSNFALTVWPVMNALSYEKNGFRLRETCLDATNLYDATTSREAINAANRSGNTDERRGPFLIAWSSKEQLGNETRHVAFMDMSWVNRPTEAAAYIRDWRELIVSDPSRWESVWNAGRFRRFGDQFYAFVGPFFE